MMLKKFLNISLAALLVLGAITPAAIAKPRPQRPITDDTKVKVAKTGTGAKAKATVWTGDGKKVKGYIAQAGDDDFVIRDRKTDAPTTIRYVDVVKYDRNQGHSTAKWVAIGASAGVGAFVLILMAYIAHVDD